MPSYAIQLPYSVAGDGVGLLYPRMPYFFKSWKARTPGMDHQPDETPQQHDFVLRSIARATSAAPTYFPPALIANARGEQYGMIDGGVFANNPGMCALVSAYKLWPDAEDYIVVSLGTGSLERPIPYNQAKDWGLVHWARPILNVLMDGNADTTCYQLDQVLGEAHYRFDISLGRRPETGPQRGQRGFRRRLPRQHPPHRSQGRNPGAGDGRGTGSGDRGIAAGEMGPGAGVSGSVAQSCPSPPFSGGRGRGPSRKRWEGEVGAGNRSGIPYPGSSRGRPSPQPLRPQGWRGSMVRPLSTDSGLPRPQEREVVMITRMTLERAIAAGGCFDRAKFESFTDADIERMIDEDPDLAPRAETLPPFCKCARSARNSGSLGTIREKLGMSLATVEKWERDETPADPVLQALLRILDRIPEPALRALEGTAEE